MFAPEEQTFEAWMKPGVEAFNSWISFFPVAPMFGVDWRFADAFDLTANSAPKPAEASMEKKVVPVPETVETKSAPVAQTRASAGTAEVIDLPSKARIADVSGEKVQTDEPAETSDKPKGLLAKAPKDADDLKLIKGVGPGLETQLNDLGIYRFRQLAKFKEADLTWIDDNLNSFKGRCFRDDWVGQAKTLLK